MRLLTFFFSILSLVRGSSFLDGLTCSSYMHIVYLSGNILAMLNCTEYMILKFVQK